MIFFNLESKNIMDQNTSTNLVGKDLSIGSGRPLKMFIFYILV